MATLVYSDVDGIDRSFALGADPIVVGRGAECAIRSSDPRVSRNHARFFVEAGALWVEDLGSSNGIYVGPNKVQRAPVPTGEIVLVGSLMIRLLPASGTLPPPMGLHGTLAQWLDLERKARAALEEERSAFAKRVGELHETLASSKSLADELAAVKQETEKLRTDHVALQKSSAQELEGVRGELAKAREAKMIAATQAGIEVAEKMAEAEMTNAELRQELARAKGEPIDDGRLADLDEQVTVLSARAEKAERDLGGAQIRAQGAERTSKDTTAKLVELEADLLKLREAEPEQKRALTDAEGRANKAVAELAAAQKELQAVRDKAAGGDKMVAERDDANAKVAKAEGQLAEANARAEEADKLARAADTMAKAMAKDVAEALKRAQDEAAKSRGVAKDLETQTKRADDAEKRDAEHVATIARLEGKLADSEAGHAEAKGELPKQLEAVRKDLGGKLEQAQRELAAERATSLALVDRKTQLERDLEAARTQLGGLSPRAELAESKIADYEHELDALHEKIQDLESGLAVEQTASKTSVDEARERTHAVETQLAEAKAAAAAATKTAAGLERRIGTLEQQLADARNAHAGDDATLAEAQATIAKLETSAGDHAELERRLQEAESKLDPLRAKAEAADLAIGRASALQRQLDESLQKLSWLERDAKSGRAPTNNEDSAKVEAAEGRARDAEGRNRDLGARLAQAEARVAELDAYAHDAGEHITDAERRAKDAQAQLADALGRAVDAERKIAEGGQTRAGGDRELAEARAKVAQLQQEVDAAENVRQFAATTEREIAQLQRELRESKQKLAQITLERDRFESELRDARDGDETTSRRGVVVDPETTHQADVSRYTALVARTSELEKKLVAAEKDDEKLRRQLADAQAALERARAAPPPRAPTPDPAEKPTAVRPTVPDVFNENLVVLEESIDSLRANMRAASDETAMMDHSEAVSTVAAAISQAAEDIERARAAVKALVTYVSAE